MGFQTTVSLKQGFGVAGELYTDGPVTAQSFILNSASAAYNIFGSAFSVVSEGIAAAGNSGGTAVFAGILVNPKASVLQGTVSGGSLASSLTLPNYAQGELITMGSIVVALPAAAAIGDYVIYDQTTGALSTISPTTSLPTGKSWAFAYVNYYTVAAAGLAVITLVPTLSTPT